MPAKRGMYLETTEVDAKRSAAEIVSELVRRGATDIHTKYSGESIVGLAWMMKIRGVPQLFQMPARVDPVERQLLARRKGVPSPQDRQRIREQAERTAWRQLLYWVRAQMALVALEMAETGEVFFPYLQSPAGHSIFEVFAEQGLRMLGPGESEERTQ